MTATNNKPTAPTTAGEAARERRAEAAKKNAAVARRVAAWRKRTYGK